jgi:hypothetical protein
MDTITLSKADFNRMLVLQEELKSELASLRDLVIDSLKDDLKPSVIKRLNSRSKKIDRGCGKRFDSISSLKSYLISL